MRPLPKGADGNIFRSASISKANYQNVRGGQLSAGSVLRAVLLFAALFGFWLAMSGHYKWWLVMLGAMIAFGLTFWAMWLDLADKEGFPVHMGLRAIIYWPWLMLEIITSALDVTRRIILLEKGIAPAMKRVRAGQKTPEGLTTFANSITLTPGPSRSWSTGRITTWWCMGSSRRTSTILKVAKWIAGCVGSRAAPDVRCCDDRCADFARAAGGPRQPRPHGV
jgi:multicomponent Na+:H+ antiporter subunit E